MLSWFNTFKRAERKREKFQVPGVTFLHEQDGPPEQLLKAKLAEMFNKNKGVDKGILSHGPFRKRVWSDFGFGNEVRA